MSGPSQKTGAGRPAPVSIRFSESERAALSARAGNLPISTYVKRVLFGVDMTPPRHAARRVAPERELLGRALAVLGKSQIGDSLSRLARLAEMGSLYCDPETLAGLQRACEDVRAMRTMLVQALGKDATKSPPAAFNEAAGRRYHR